MRLTDDALELLDQRLLPGEEKQLRLTSGEQVAQAIEQMAVRGAPAIGVTAAFGLVVELRRARQAGADLAALRAACDAVSVRLRATRPTAVNLAWALDEAARELEPLFASDTEPAALVEAAEKWALRLQEDDLRICHAIGDLGAPLLDFQPFSRSCSHAAHPFCWLN